MSLKKSIFTLTTALLVALSVSVSAYAQTGTVTADILNVRSTTSVSAPVITRLSQNDVIEILAYDGYWYKILLSDGQIGYASAEFISPSVAYYGVVTATSLTVRTSTGTYYPARATLPYGSVVELLAYDGYWYKIRYADGETGFVSAEYISMDLSLAVVEQKPYTIAGYVNATNLNIRSTTDVTSAVITTLPMGTCVDLAAYDGLWYKLILSDGTEGYASADYISLSPIDPEVIAASQNNVSPTTPAAPPTDDTYALGNRIVATAYEYLGVPYVYAASGPDSFDCSGFTMYVMSLNGVDLPHQSGSQYSYGFEVSKDELIAGDLVFFNSKSNSGVAHVGIYIGNGQFIHASSGRAYSVTVSSLTDDYYTAHYLGARRVI